MTRLPTAVAVWCGMKRGPRLTTARAIVRRCTEDSIVRRVAFADIVREDPEVRSHLSESEVLAALDPAGYLGSIDELIQRAQDAHRAAGAHA